MCGFVMLCLMYLWRVCVRFSLMCLYDVRVMYCVMVHGVCLCVLCICVRDSFNVRVCGVGWLLFDVV